MPRENYTHVTLVVDRSGSMSNLAADMTGGINTLLDEQFKEDGEISVTLVEFDDHDQEVRRMSRENFEYRLVPRGSTALLDTVGREIVRTGEDLNRLPESDRPARVLFVVVTDGHENASVEYNLEAVRSLISTQTSTYGWTFSFLGAEDSAWQGRDLGVRSASFSRSGAATNRSMRQMNEKMKSFRKMDSSDTFFELDDEIDS